MHNQPRNNSPKPLHVSKGPTAANPNLDNSQHGLEPYFLHIPAESLGHITAYLEPPALLSLAQANRLLHDHVESDNIWLRAFLVFFLDIGPEIAIDSVIQTIPRLKATWRDEYIARFKLVRRWQRSRAPTVTHAPQWAPISEIHLMVDGAALLSASVLQGVVARSHVLTGKKFKGFIDSGGRLVQRPTGDHSLPSVMALTSDGGTGKCAWGFFSGDIAFTRMPHVMDLGAPRHSVCLPEDAHAGAVTCLEFSPGGHILATASADGSVKLWGSRHLRCFWTFTPSKPLEERDPCLRLVLHQPSGTVIAGMQSGEILLWTGFEIDASGESCLTQNLKSVTVPVPSILEGDASPSTTRTPTVALLEFISAQKIALGVLYDGEPCVRRIDVDIHETPTSDMTTSAPNSHALTRLRSSLLSTSMTSPLISGDKAGWVQIWDWQSLRCSRSWSAHDDGYITALESNDTLLATGSSGGSITVWDALTHQSLRSFSTPVPRNLTQVGDEDVTRLVISDSHVVGCVGNRVVAWRVDRRVPLGLAGKGKSKGGTARYVSPKWQDQLEMKKAIAESFDALEADDASGSGKLASIGRAREQRTALGEMGLEESEALEYVLMLSRDEEEERQRHILGTSLESTSSFASLPSQSSSDRSESSLHDDSDGDTSPRTSIHDDDDDGHNEMFPMTPIPSPPMSPALTAWSSRRSSVASSAQPRAMPTSSNRKVQVTPPFRPEAVEAGTSPSAFSLDGPLSVPRTSSSRAPEFPAMSVSSSPNDQWTGHVTKAGTANASPRRLPVVSPPTSPPLHPAARSSTSKTSTTSNSPPKPVKAWSSVVRASPAVRNGSVFQAAGRHSRPSMVPRNAVDEEEMLRLALEASLAET